MNNKININPSSTKWLEKDDRVVADYFCRTEYSVHSRLVFKRNQAAISILKEVFAMNETDYNARLYEKMKAEQDKYRDWLLHQEPSEILNHTYEYTMREDIVMCMEELELEPEKARATERRQSVWRFGLSLTSWA